MNFVLLCLVFIYPAGIRRWWGKSVLGGRAAYTKTLGQEMLGCILQVEELSVVRMRKARRDSGIRCSWDQGLGEGKPGIMHPYELCQEGLAIIRIRGLLWMVSGTFPLNSYTSIVIAFVPVCGS